MPWLSIIFRISHSCLAAKFGLIGPALVHIMGATITCNLKPLMIKSSFIHDCAPQSLGPITFFFFFFFSLSQIHTFGMISACGTRIIKSRGEWLTKRIVNFLARLSFLWLYTRQLCESRSIPESQKAWSDFFKCTREFSFVTLKKENALWGLSVSCHPYQTQVTTSSWAVRQELPVRPYVKR